MGSTVPPMKLQKATLIEASKNMGKMDKKIPREWDVASADMKQKSVSSKMKCGEKNGFFQNI